MDIPATAEWTSPAVALAAAAFVPTIVTVFIQFWTKKKDSTAESRRFDLDERKQTSADRQALLDSVRQDNRDLRSEVDRLEAALTVMRADRDRGWDLCRSWYQFSREMRHGWANASMVDAGKSKQPPAFIPRMDAIEGTTPDNFNPQGDPRP